MERHCIIKDFLKVPNECIEDTVIAKNVIADEGNLKTKDKNIFKDYIRQIKWCYNFSDRNVRIPKYKDEKRDYDEVQLFNIILKDENFSKIPGVNKYSKQYFKEDKKIERVVDILFRFVPYPIIIVVQYKKEIKFFATHISNHLVDSSKITLDKIFTTNWINTENMDNFEIKFIEDIQYENQDLTNIYTFYKGYADSIIKYNGVITAGHEVKLSSDEIQEINSIIDNLNKEVQNLRKKLKKETQPNKIVKINNKIRDKLFEEEELIKKLE